MSKRKKEMISDLTSKESLAPPLSVAERRDQEIASEKRIAQDRIRYCPSRDTHIAAGRKKGRASFRPVQFTTLSRVVDKAFTGWTIKTQKQS